MNINKPVNSRHNANRHGSAYVGMSTAYSSKRENG